VALDTTTGGSLLQRAGSPKEEGPMRVRILRDTIARGSYQEAGTEVDLTRADAEKLIRMRKAEAISPEPEPELEEKPIETATAEPPENAMKPPARRGKMGR
jgi:hypothetical protein